MLNLSVEYNQRAAIVALDACILRVSMIYGVWLCYHEIERVREIRQGKPTQKSAMFIQRTQELTFEDPGQLIRKLSPIVGMSENCIRRIVEDDLYYKSYTIRVRQMHSEE